MASKVGNARNSINEIALQALDSAIRDGVNEQPVEDAMRTLLRLQCLRIAEFVETFQGVGKAVLAKQIRENKWDAPVIKNENEDENNA